MLLPVTLVCILINALVSSIPAVFLQKVIALVDQSYKSGDWSAVSGKILGLVGDSGDHVCDQPDRRRFLHADDGHHHQGSLKKMRQKMFNHMQDLPIRYFDTNGHGDIMSYYTNDVDTCVSSSARAFPTFLSLPLRCSWCSASWFYYSVILALVVVVGVVCMVFAARAITKRSSAYFLRQQVTLANAEAFMEEMMTGQKVIKVFCHEEAAKADFDKVNDEIFFNARNGNRFANIPHASAGQCGQRNVCGRGPGGRLPCCCPGPPNISLSGMAFSISIRGARS